MHSELTSGIPHWGRPSVLSCRRKTRRRYISSFHKFGRDFTARNVTRQKKKKKSYYVRILKEKGLEGAKYLGVDNNSGTCIHSDGIYEIHQNYAQDWAIVVVFIVCCVSWLFHAETGEPPSSSACYLGSALSTLCSPCLQPSWQPNSALVRGGVFSFSSFKG